MSSRFFGMLVAGSFGMLAVPDVNSVGDRVAAEKAVSGLAQTTTTTGDGFREVTREVQTGVLTPEGKCVLGITITDKSPFPAGQMVMADYHTCTFVVAWGFQEFIPFHPNSVSDIEYLTSPKAKTHSPGIPKMGYDIIEKSRQRPSDSISPMSGPGTYDVLMQGYFHHPIQNSFVKIDQKLEWTVHSLGSLTIDGWRNRTAPAEFQWRNSYYNRGIHGTDSVFSHIVDVAAIETAHGCSDFYTGAEMVEAKFDAFNITGKPDGTHTVNVVLSFTAPCTLVTGWFKV